MLTLKNASLTINKAHCEKHVCVHANLFTTPADFQITLIDVAHFDLYGKVWCGQHTSSHILLENAAQISSRSPTVWQDFILKGLVWRKTSSDGTKCKGFHSQNSQTSCFKNSERSSAWSHWTRLWSRCSYVPFVQHHAGLHWLALLWSTFQTADVLCAPTSRSWFGMPQEWSYKSEKRLNRREGASQRPSVCLICRWNSAAEWMIHVCLTSRVFASANTPTAHITHSLRRKIGFRPGIINIHCELMCKRPCLLMMNPSTLFNCHLFFH